MRGQVFSYATAKKWALSALPRRGIDTFLITNTEFGKKLIFTGFHPLIISPFIAMRTIKP
jgi:hypothetical protein